MNQFFPDYNRYFINYKHPLSISGMMSLTRETLYNLMTTSSISEMDKLIVDDVKGWLIPDIQNFDIDTKGYKFQVFPKYKDTSWEVLKIEDISLEEIKRFKCNLIIEDQNINKNQLLKILFSITQKIKQLENKKNPHTKIKFGKVDADLVLINVFYRQYERTPLSQLANNPYFICNVYYYRTKSTQKISVPLQDNYIFESIKKFDIYWNKNWLK